MYASRVFVGVAGLLLLICRHAEGQNGGGRATISSYYPSNGPISGGAMISITGTGFITTGNIRSKCNFRDRSGRASAFGRSQISNSTHITCILPDTSFFFTFPLRQEGELVRLSVTAGTGQSSDPVDFLVYDTSSILITSLTPNQALTNTSNGTRITITGQGFIDTGEITCALESHAETITPATFTNYSSLQCSLPLRQVASRIRVIVSLNGQVLNALPSLAGVLMFTFYSSPPQIVSSYLSSSYVRVTLQFDREAEIGAEEIRDIETRNPADNFADLRLDCSEVFNRNALSLIGSTSVCVWHNSQQRAVIVHLSSDSDIRVGTHLGINEHSIRTRNVLYSRQATGSVAIASTSGIHLLPTVVLEAPSSIPMCSDFTITGEKSLNGGPRSLEYEWRVGMEVDQLVNLIPDPLFAMYVPVGFTTQSRLTIPSTVFYSEMASGSGSGSVLAPLDTYFVQLSVRNFLGFNSTAFLHNVTTTRIPFPAVVIIGEQSRRVQPWRDVLLEGKMLRAANDCTIEFRVSRYSWSIISDAGLNIELGGVKISSTVLILPPDTLQPGSLYTATLTVEFNTGHSSTASVSLMSEEKLEAKLVGGVRRGVGIHDIVDLDGRTSVIHHHPSVLLSVSWSCSAVSVPELGQADSSCENFTSSDNLTVSMPEGSLASGGYQFTLNLSLIRRGPGGNVVTLKSSATQLVIVFPTPVPIIKIITTQSDNFNSVLVHEKFSLDAEVLSLHDGSVFWSTEYVVGYGRLQLQPNISRTPLQYSLCSSLQSCPHSEASTNLYATALVTDPPQTSPLLNRPSLVLQHSLLLPQNQYRFKLSMINSLGHLGFAEIDIQTESGPSSGRVEITPMVGGALSTIFTLRALDWTDDTGRDPFLYRLGFQYFCPNQNVLVCKEWMTGLSQDNEYLFILPDINSELHPKLLLQISNSNRAARELTRSFNSLVSTNPPVFLEGRVIVPSATETTDLSALMEDIGTLIRSGHWVQGLAQLTSVLSSVNLDHELIICNTSQLLLSPKFRLSNLELIELKMRALQVVLDLHHFFIPKSQSHIQIILSLLQKITKTQCNFASHLDPQWDETNVTRVLDLLENIVNVSNSFSEFGVLSNRGLSREGAQTILSIFEQLMYSQNEVMLNGSSDSITQIQSNRITDTLSRTLLEISYGLCVRQKLNEESVSIDSSSFLNLKSSLINLPPDYVAGGCSSDRCRFEPVRINFGTELFSLYLQWLCSGGSYCSGVCITSTQIYLDFFWRENEFSSLVKTPILHLSLQNPSNGMPVVAKNSSSEPVTSFPLLAPYSNTSNLVCVAWDESSSSWVGSYCQTEVLQSSSRVLCRCSVIGSFFYAVLERCPDGYYGGACNQTCPQGLWGPECRMTCSCSNRGTCSAVNGSCDCNPGWMGANCDAACTEGFHGKLCNKVCHCQNGAACDHVNGECGCTPGWIGLLCNISCMQGSYGDGCASPCQCRNASECDFVTGVCTCQAGYIGSTCQDRCPSGFYGLECTLPCRCFPAGTRSCDHIGGSCDCHEIWMGELCDIQVTTPPPTVPPVVVQAFQIWWAIVGVVVALLAAVGMTVILVVVVVWRKNRKRKKVFPVSPPDIEGTTDSSQDSGSASDVFVSSRTRSLEVLVPKGMSLEDIFLSSSPVAETGAVVEFKEPQEMDGKFRWQIIRVLSEVGSEGRKSGLTDKDGCIVLESRESSRPASKAHNPDVDSSDRDKGVPNQQDQTEIVYRRGIYLNNDATLKDLRNQFINSEQQEQEDGVHFQFLRSDVPGDRIEIDTEDEILLSQIEDNLLQRWTIYVESIDTSLAIGELCMCGKFADLECTSCRKRGYCSTECQENDWPKHEGFCRAVSSRRERRQFRRKSRGSHRSSSSSEPLFSEDTCVCGKGAEYECSGCRKQGYCSGECQTEDWSFHEYYCSQPGSSAARLASHTPINMMKARGKLQTVFEEPESSIEAH